MRMLLLMKMMMMLLLCQAAATAASATAGAALLNGSAGGAHRSQGERVKPRVQTRHLRFALQAVHMLSLAHLQDGLLLPALRFCD